jgi:hypothetical protein
MASYNRIKASKAVPIGTIMPWTGSSSTTTLTDSGIPNGWIICRGQTLRAIDYPLLARLLKNTYGPFQEPGGPFVGIVNNYPLYDENDLFNLPNLNNISMVDLEGSRLDPSDLTKVGTYITENGSDAAPLTNIVSYVDVNFAIQSDAQLAGKITGITLQDPAYFDTIRTIPRKLGVDHTSSHTHPQPAGSPYPSTSVSGGYVALFEAGTWDSQDSQFTTVSSAPMNADESTADRFNPGTAQLTWYDEAGVSLPVMDRFRDFTGTSAVIPVIPGGSRNIPSYGNTNTYSDPNTCIVNVQQPAITAPFPPAGIYQGLRNHYDSTDAPSEPADRRGQNASKPYPVTLNHNADTWNSESLASHNHFTVDISMNRGQMRLPGTILINNMTTGTIAPVSVDKALSVQINPNTPSLTTLVIMRAF